VRPEFDGGLELVSETRGVHLRFFTQQWTLMESAGSQEIEYAAYVVHVFGHEPSDGQHTQAQLKAKRLRRDNYWLLHPSWREMADNRTGDFAGFLLDAMGTDPGPLWLNAVATVRHANSIHVQFHMPRNIAPDTGSESLILWMNGNKAGAFQRKHAGTNPEFNVDAVRQGAHELQVTLTVSETNQHVLAQSDVLSVCIGAQC